MLRNRMFCSSILIAMAIATSSCRALYDAKRPYQVYEKPAEYFAPLVNNAEEARAEEPTIVLENPEYPIELSLYKDKTFRYYLARLGDGQGTWTYKDGHIQLYAERKLFVMQMQMHSTVPDADAEIVALEFSDRFGPKFLPLTKK